VAAADGRGRVTWRRCCRAAPKRCFRAALAGCRLHEKGLIYRGSYLVNWSPALGTAVSDLEVEYSEEPGSLYFFKWVLWLCARARV
jgi:valyl-tRNA synthetase